MKNQDSNASYDEVGFSEGSDSTVRKADISMPRTWDLSKLELSTHIILANSARNSRDLVMAVPSFSCSSETPMYGTATAEGRKEVDHGPSWSRDKGES